MAKTRLELTAQLNRMKAATAAAPITPTEFADFLNDWVNYMTNDGEYSAGVLEQWKTDTLNLQNANLNANIQAAINAATQALASANSAVAVAQGTATARPSTRPTLLLDFANTRYFDPKILAAFSRNSIATYVDRNGVMRTAAVNKPRFQHDPITKESLGLLMEETRTNLATFSNDFSNVSHTKARATLQNVPSVLDPDLTTATKLVEDTSVTNTHQLTKGDCAVVAGQTYTGSIFLKAAERSVCIIQLSSSSVYGGVNPSVIVDLGLGTLSASNNNLSSTIENWGNGWYRVSVTAMVVSNGISGVNVQLCQGQTPTYTGDGTSGAYLFGLQFEQGLNPTSYIPTTTTAVTRITDKISVTGALFSEIFQNLTEGTLFISAKKASQRLNTYKFYARFLGDNTAGGNNSIGLTDHASLVRIYGEIYANGVSTYQNTSFSVDFGTYFLNALAWKTNDAKSYSNGVVGASDADVVLPTNLNQFIIGDEINTIIKQVAFYPRRVTDPALAALSTSGLFGKNAIQAPTIGDLASSAFLSPYAILRNQGKNLFKINGTGAQVTDNINLNFDFNFELVTTAGATFTSTPNTLCTAGTDNLLVVTVPVGKTLWYAITPVFEY